MNPQPNGNVNGAANTAAILKQDLRPTHDQMYLASRINDGTEKGRITPAAIQKLNTRYGVVAVSDALRTLRGFPPEIPVRSSFAYLEAMCQEWT